jgi:predicted histone-like DNA-binding protein
MRELAGQISQISTVSSIDTMAVLEALLTIVPQELAAGNIVELGDFGSFWLKANTEGANTAEEVHSVNIASVAPSFRAGKEFKNALNTVKFEKA